jgi:hypothetical protein
MGRVEEGKIVNHTGVARPCLDEQELKALIYSLDKLMAWMEANDRTTEYYKGLKRLRKKLEKNKKRVMKSGKHPYHSLYERHSVVFV